MIYQSFQSIPRDIHSIAEVFLRRLSNTLANEVKRFNSEYPIRATQELAPGNVQDAMAVVRNDELYPGDFAKLGQNTYYWGDLFVTDGMAKALLQHVKIVLGDHPQNVQTQNDIPEAHMAKVVREANLGLVTETRDKSGKVKRAKIQWRIGSCRRRCKSRTIQRTQGPYCRPLLER